MENEKSPRCGHETIPDEPCPACTQTNGNGKAIRPKPTPPPQVATWHIERATPEMLEEARRTFNEAEFLAGVREIEAGGGVQIDDLIAEIEREINGCA